MKSAFNQYNLISKINEQLLHFEVATQVECFAVSKTKDLFPTKKCDFCIKVSNLSGQELNCYDSLIHSAYQSDRFDGRYIFYCPMGLVHFASPIYAKGHIFAVAVGGPVLLVDKDDYLSEDIINKYKIDKGHLKALKNSLKTVSYLPPYRVTSLSQMLFSVCTYISGHEQLRFIGDEQSIGNEMEKYLSFISTMGAIPSKDTYPIEKERELLSFISLGDREHSQELLDDILGHILSYSNKEFEKAKARILELVVLLSRAAVEGGADLNEIFGLNYKFLNQINTYNTIEELSNWLFNITARFVDCVFKKVDTKHKDTISKATEYINNNFSHKITLSNVADYVYLSPSYFSKVFSEEMGISFNNYLNQVRIENSKRLLATTDLDMNTISEVVGFDDQSYFSKVFKKFTDVTPGRYRQRHGK